MKSVRAATKAATPVPIPALTPRDKLVSSVAVDVASGGRTITIERAELVVLVCLIINWRSCCQGKGSGCEGDE
jgi:hypothetical protein